MTAVDAVTDHKARIPLVSGKPVEFRFPQMLAWGIIAGLLGACFVAGLYYALWQVDWYVHIGSVHFQVFYLKKVWDAGTWWPSWLGHWAIYRHATFRNLLEPEVAIMAVGTLLAKPTSWADRCGKIRLLTAPFILVGLAIVLNTAGTWLLNFGLPANARTIVNWQSAGTLALGFAIGHFILRPFWAPVGALLQGDRIDASVGFARKYHRVPLWETYPLMPPVIRERFAEGWRKATAPLRATGANRWLLTILAIVIMLVTVLGGLAKFGFAHGYRVPYLNP